MQYDFIIITGPTAVGKTALSLELGKLMPIEIINGDMGQLYTPLSIGTGAPPLTPPGSMTLDPRLKYVVNNIPHHLYDFLDEPVNYTVLQYRQQAQEHIAAIRQRGAMPVIVGGSGFYIQSLFFPPKHLDSASPVAVTSPASDNCSFWERLNEIDPKRAAAIHSHDTYRIQRALSLWYTTGQLPSLSQPSYEPLRDIGSGQPLRVLLLMVTRERAELHTMIEQRVKEMMDAGWLEEVAQLSPAWRKFLMVKKIIGYREIIEYQEHTSSYQELITTIQQRTRGYAKRQIIFLNKLMRELAALTESTKPSVAMANLTLLSLPLYIKQLVNTLHCTGTIKEHKA